MRLWQSKPSLLMFYLVIPVCVPWIVVLFCELAASVFGSWFWARRRPCSRTTFIEDLTLTASHFGLNVSTFLLSWFCRHDLSKHAYVLEKCIYDWLHNNVGCRKWTGSLGSSVYLWRVVSWWMKNTGSSGLYMNCLLWTEPWPDEADPSSNQLFCRFPFFLFVFFFSFCFITRLALQFPRG